VELYLVEDAIAHQALVVRDLIQAAQQVPLVHMKYQTLDVLKEPFLVDDATELQLQAALDLILVAQLDHHVPILVGTHAQMVGP
jgi:hypothetical protein